MKKVGVAIMGLGVVGGGTYEIIKSNHKEIMASDGVDLEVVRVLEKNPARFEAFKVPENIGTSNIHDILNDPRVSIVVETIGGIEPAKTFVLAALKAGKSVVTSNKELLAKHWPELESEAKRNRAGLYFEASCVGGVPIIRALDLSMQANVIKELTGIINGTTNYILTKMTEKGAGYAAALKEAQALGYAEANPESDVEGFDAVYKLSILSSIAFNTCIPIDAIHREGITKVTADDIKYAKELGYKIKLLGISKLNGKRIEAHVHPTLVPDEHPLASVRNSFNSVYLKGDHVGELMFYGKGAGAHPTGSAVVSDIVLCACLKGNHRYAFFKNDGKLDKGIKMDANFRSKYYIRMNALDKPGVLAKISAVLGKNKISIEQLIQKNSAGDAAPIIFMTHVSDEKSVNNAVAALKQLDVVDSVESVIRVIDYKQE